MLVHGDRGHNLLPSSDILPENELEEYGVDWEGLEDISLLSSRQTNSSNRDTFTSWIGHRGPPDNLNEVALEAPNLPIPMEEAQIIYNTFYQSIGCTEENDIDMLWNNGLSFARLRYGDSF